MAAGKKKKLGKGLDAIFNDASQGADLQSMINAIEKKSPQLSQVMISIDEIRPNPYQPRKHFDQEKLNELAQSIHEHGIFQPIIVKKSISGYEIVAGERRFRAASIVGLKELPAIIVDFTDQQMMEIALLENIQREDLNAIEEAKAYQTMMEKLDLTQDELSKRVGKSRAHIANTVRLLKMPQKLQDYVLEGRLTMGHIKPLITIDEKKALEIAKKAIKENLSVRAVEDIVKGIKLQNARKAKPKVEKPKEYVYVEGLLRKKYRTKIKVDDNAITIKYTNTEDLNRILELMGVIEED
jgi:ParB family chromosome partitioning protein